VRARAEVFASGELVAAVVAQLALVDWFAAAGGSRTRTLIPCSTLACTLSREDVLTDSIDVTATTFVLAGVYLQA
jgi:hypothetical protein